jgi:hypothetical protein
MAMVFAIAVSASAAAASPSAFASSADAYVAIGASFARFAKVAMTVAFCACLASSSCLILSFLTVSPSAAARSMSISCMALRSRCCRSSSSVDGSVPCLAR